MRRKRRQVTPEANDLDAMTNTPHVMDLCGHQVKVTNKWFVDHTQELWEERLLPHITPEHTRYLELGVCEGQSMVWMLQNTKLDCVGVDPYIDLRGRKPEAFERYKQRAFENLQPFIDAGRLELAVAHSQDWLCKAIADEVERFDVVYVDGDHRAAPAIADMILGWKMLKPGGLMLLDDTNRRWSHGQPLTMEGTRSFLDAVEDRMYVIFRHPENVLVPKAWCIYKRKDRGWL